MVTSFVIQMVEHLCTVGLVVQIPVITLQYFNPHYKHAQALTKVACIHHWLKQYHAAIGCSAENVLQKIIQHLNVHVCIKLKI